VDFGEAGDCTNAHSFHDQFNYLRGLLSLNVMLSKWFLARLRECGLAGGATETLDFVASESEFLGFGVLASQQVMGFSLFSFFGEALQSNSQV